MRDKLRKLFLDIRGATAIEYGLLVALIAIGIIGALRTLGSTIDDTFTRVESGLNQ